jgi:hypothetical protein
MATDAEPLSLTLMRLLDGYQLTQAIAVAAELAIADLLADGPCSSDELADASGANPQALYRLLRTLASIGVFHEEEGRRFSLTPLSEYLRTDAPESLRGLASQRSNPSHWSAWGALLHSVRTGENAFRHVHGLSVWNYRARFPEEQAVFDQAMTALSRRAAAGALDAYDFGNFSEIVDVGGGQGALLAGILVRHPNTHGVLFDQPQVAARAEQMLQQRGVLDRCRVVGGDFFAAVPEGGDLYVLRQVLHDWPDAEATAILRTCRRAIPAGGRLVIIERVIAPPNEGFVGKLGDLNMLVAPGGQERTQAEYSELLAEAGFRLTETFPTAVEDTLIEAVPV